ncbi:hypothetical protein F5884DRAFT_132566 [Xylogone sp. PMI_703]|nr:hypothetical protein F5884DRAFT_132566 [Xylogone sp. PMI_703]
MTEVACGQPKRDRTTLVSVTGIVGVSFALVIFIIRVVAKALYSHFGMDAGNDYSNVASHTFFIMLSIPLWSFTNPYRFTTLTSCSILEA